MSAAAPQPEYTGRSILDDIVVDGDLVRRSPSGSASSSSPTPPSSTARALLLTLDGGTDVAIQHDGDPAEAPVVHRFGERFVQFSSGQHVRADRIMTFLEVTPAEAKAAAERPMEPVPTILMNPVAPIQQQAQTTLDDLPYAMWPLEALKEEEKRMDPQGTNTSDDLTEIRSAIARHGGKT